MNAATKSPGTGTGLRNTRERLTQLYGDRGVMTIADAPGGGTLVTVHIPIAPNGNGQLGHHNGVEGNGS
jgi:sensor histidine kinase YesM